MSSASSVRFTEPGPFRADQLHDGDRYELSNGHPIQCHPSSERHSNANLDAGRVLATDPATQGAGVDVGLSFNEGKNLRAPDIAVGPFQRQPGWSKVVPPLVVEYADTGQDEAALQTKIAELLELGVRYIWIVRLLGPLRVEVYEPGKAMQRVDGEGELRAPGVLQNAVPVRALVDEQAANQATLRNLLNREGYSSIDAILAKGRQQGLCEALLVMLQALGVKLSAEAQARIAACTDSGLLDQWLKRAATAHSSEDVFGSQ